MNELQVKNNGAMVVQQPAQIGFNFFDPVQFETMQRVCRMFALSDLVPDIYRATIKQFPANADEKTVTTIQAENQTALTKAMANCMIAVDYAMRVGASPMMVMQNVAIIYGRPAPSSKFLIATVNTCGRFNPLQYRFTEKGMLGMVDYTDYVWDNTTRSKRAVAKQFDGKKVMDIECVAFTTAKGSDKVLESSPVSVRLAIQEGWFTKNGSKWQTMTRQMLMYRAASFWSSAYAPEISMGMKTVEELQDIQDVEYQKIKDNPEKERKNNANKVQISMDLADGEDKTTKVVVDTQTGEIKNENPTEAPQAEQPQNSPGF